MCTDTVLHVVTRRPAVMGIGLCTQKVGADALSPWRSLGSDLTHPFHFNASFRVSYPIFWNILEYLLYPATPSHGRPKARI